MLLYHGSTLAVNKPEIRIARKTKDFSQGFYCTTIKKQAERWSTRFGKGVVTEYVYTPSSQLKFLKFETMTEAWLDFVIDCRLGKHHIYDIVEGPMADDEVYLTVQDYINGEISRKAFWALVEFRYPTHQISFHTQDALETLNYIKDYEVKI